MIRAMLGMPVEHLIDIHRSIERWVCERLSDGLALKLGVSRRGGSHLNEERSGKDDVGADVEGRIKCLQLEISILSLEWGASDV